MQFSSWLSYFLKGEKGKASPLVWTSNKLKHVVKSPKAAETLSIQLAAEYAFLLKSFLIEVYKIDNTHIPVISIIDNLSFHESMYSTNVIDDKRLYINTCSMHDMLSRNEISDVKLTSLQDQLVDCLTKDTASIELLMQVMAGEVDLPAV